MSCPIVLIIAIVLCKLAPAKEIGWIAEEDAKWDLEFELLKKIEIERMKTQIISELGLTNLPIIPSNSSPSLSDSVIQLLLAEHNPSPKQHNNYAKLLFFPTNRDFHCLKSKIPSCRRFEFSILPNMIYNSSEFWMYKVKSCPGEDPTLKAVSSHRGEEEEQLELENYEIPKEDENWLSFPLFVFEQLKLSKGNTTCAVEITGMEVGEEKNNLPFLKVIQDLKSYSRSRRSEDSQGTKEACRAIPFQVSFEEIGFSEFVIHPKNYEANVCSGYCLKSPNTYETILDLVYQRNAAFKAQYGRCWATCCRPKEYGNMDFIHNSNIDGAIVHNVTTLTNIIVRSCVCS